MNFFDLHCDTLSEIYKHNKNLYENDLHVSLERAKNIDNYIGCFAIWMPDDYRGNAAIKYFDSVYKNFGKEILRNLDHMKVLNSARDIENLEHSKAGVFITVEGGSVLAGRIDRVKYLYDCGVKVITLTWNGSNEIGGGSAIVESGGITEFGIKALKEMEKYGIIVDVSHASEKLFYDVNEVSQKPFIATHSNSYSVCKHKRNLTDEQFKIIRDRGGLVGITFCKNFLKDCGKVSFCDIMNHVEHFLSLSGEDTVAIGSDFDGADMPRDLNGIQFIENLYQYFLMHNYSETLVNKIFFGNSCKFFKSMI